MIDSTPSVNQYFQNTLWVPGHFHTYMALGVMLFVIGAVYHILPDLTGIVPYERIAKRALTFILIGGYGFVLSFLSQGALGNPRRYTYALRNLDWIAWLGVFFAGMAAYGTLLIFKDIGLKLVRIILSP